MEAGSGRTGQANATSRRGLGLYTRQATGFVRDLGLGSNVAISLSFMSIPFGVLILTTGALAFPGANLLLVIVLGGILCVPIVVLFSWFGTVMPRSGGDYVSESRIIASIVGFVANANLSLWFLLVIAIFAAILTSFGLSGALASMGVALHSKSLIQWSARVATKPWEFWVGAATLTATTVLMSFSIRIRTKIFQVIFYLSLLGVIVAIFVMLFQSREAFQAALPSFGAHYNSLLSASAKAGYPLHVPFSLVATLAATPLAYGFFGFGIVPVYSGGEIRSPRRTLIRALFISVIVGGLLLFLISAAALSVFGHDFLGGATYLSYLAPDKYPFASPSFLFLYASMATTNRLLIAIMGISFVLAMFAAFPPSWLILSRNLFAWSFDRIFPVKLTEVDDRTHSPIIANVTVLALTLVFLALAVYGPASITTLLVSEIAGCTLTWMAAAVSAIVRRRSMKDPRSRRSASSAFPR